MDIIKLNAIPSTNDYLKELAVSNVLNDFTIVVAENQTQGKGQMGSVWQVEPSTNLTFSVLLGYGMFSVEDVFTLNVSIANAIHKVLLSFGLDMIRIKWPNDIMSYNKKIGGILIENQLKTNGDIQSIIGVGLNVSQMNFDGLPQASSILKSHGVLVDKNELMIQIVTLFKEVVLNLEANKTNEWNYYHQYLFKKNIPVTFETSNGTKFTGMISDVNQLGQLGVLNEADDLIYYNLKEIKMLY